MENTNMNPEYKKDKESLKGALFASTVFVGGVIVIMWIAVFWLFMARV